MFVNPLSYLCVRPWIRESRWESITEQMIFVSPFLRPFQPNFATLTIYYGTNKQLPDSDDVSPYKLCLDIKLFYQIVYILAPMKAYMDETFVIN